MRVAVVSDTHLPRHGRRLPELLLRECAAADLILHAGDLVRHSILAELEAYGTVAAVLGNCDDPELYGLLPTQRVVAAGAISIGVIHDAGSSAGRAERLAARFPGCAVAVYGHSHMPVIERSGGLLMVNPGSAIDRRRAPTCTMALLDVDDDRVTARLVDLPGG